MTRLIHPQGLGLSTKDYRERKAAKSAAPRKGKSDVDGAVSAGTKSRKATGKEKPNHQQVKPRVKSPRIKDPQIEKTTRKPIKDSGRSSTPQSPGLMYSPGFFPTWGRETDVPEDVILSLEATSIIYTNGRRAVDRAPPRKRG